MINRCVVIVRPNKPYLQWADSVNDGGLLPSFDGEKTAYLLPSNQMDHDGQLTIEQCYEGLFESELANWHQIEQQWPAERSYAMFRQWFTVEWHSVVEDLCADPVLDDTV